MNDDKHSWIYGSMKGTISELGDILGPLPDQPWDSELGIAYRGEKGEAVYYTGSGIETTDDLQ